MAKIYLIKTSSGTYEDYSTHISKAFYKEEDAEKYKDTYNERLVKDKEQYNKCVDCPSHRFYDEADEEYKEWVSTVEQKCKEYCDLADIELRGKDYYECKNEPSRYSDEAWDATIITMEIE